MRRYLSVYRQTMALNWNRLTAYRKSVLSAMVSSVTWGLFSLATIVFLTGRTESAFGWSRDEIVLLTGAYSVLIAVFHTLFSRNFETFSWLISHGELDTYLVKPIDAQFAVTTRFINYMSLSRIVIGGGCMAYVLGRIGVPVDARTVMWSIVLFAAGLAVLYDIWFMAITAIVWFPRLQNIVDLMYLVSGLARFPREMSQPVLRYVLVFLLPLTFIITAPVKAILMRPAPTDAAWLIGFAFALSVAARWFWKRALIRYESAGG